MQLSEIQYSPLLAFPNPDNVLWIGNRDLGMGSGVWGWMILVCCEWAGGWVSARMGFLMKVTGWMYLSGNLEVRFGLDKIGSAMVLPCLWWGGGEIFESGVYMFLDGKMSGRESSDRFSAIGMGVRAQLEERRGVFLEVIHCFQVIGEASEKQVFGAFEGAGGEWRNSVDFTN